MTSSKMGMKTQTCTIVKDWSDVIMGYHDNAVTLVMDSYYLSKARRTYMNENGVNYIAGLKSDRFRAICKALSSKVGESGQTAVMYNNNTNETAVLHWSMNAVIQVIGKRYVMSNAFRKLIEQRIMKKQRNVAKTTNELF